MAVGPTAATISVRQTLELLDGPFAAMAAGVAEDRYAFWLGSGISFGRVDGLWQVVSRVIEFLRARIDPTDDQCKFKAALDEALSHAALTRDERARVDLSAPFEAWPDADAITARLINNYARFLDTQVDGEEADYLLWSAVDVAGTYANPDKRPDVEHLCLALLALEGVASELATANWDNLIEKAADELTGGQPCLVVCVRPEDLREPNQRARLYKFHGCAALASAREGDYRPFLIARASQINSWTARQEHAALLTRLIDIIVSKPTLMMGLSAQDANIQAVFATAEAHSRWPWPGQRPSFVFSGDRIGADQQGLLQNVYRAVLTPENRQQIIDSAIIRAYAKPLLLALSLHVLCAKLCRLIDLAPGLLTPADRADLKAGVTTLRDQVASVGDGDRLHFVRELITRVGRAVSLYRVGTVDTVAGQYSPLTTTGVHQMGTDYSIPATGLSELAILIGILGMGARDGSWSIQSADPTDPASGTVVITSAIGSATMVFTSNSHTAVRLQTSGYLGDADEAVLVQGLELARALQRSPRSSPGRTGKLGLRQVSITEMLEEAANSNDLLQRFREGVAV